MLTDRKLRIATEGYLAELGVMQRLERPSEAEVAERVGGYFRLRFLEAVAALPGDSSVLAEALSEMLALVMGEEEIVGWQPVELEGARSRITHPLDNTPLGKCPGALTTKKAGNLFLDVRVWDGLSH